MTYDQIISDLKNGVFKPIYFLSGLEAYYIDKIADYIEENVLSEDDKAFNQIVMYGRDSTITNVIEAARRFPMMARFQVVIVKEAQNVDKIEELIKYLVNPQKSTILVIAYKYKELKGKKLKDAVEAHGVWFQSDKLYENQIAPWITSYLQQRGKQIETKAAVMMTDFLGNDLSKLVNEIEKLIITLPADSNRITANDVEKNIGISKDYNNYELQDALATRNILKSNRIVDYFTKNPKNNPLVVTLTVLFGFYSNLLACYYLRRDPKSPSFIVNPSEYDIAQALGTKPFFAKQYQAAMQKYNYAKVGDIVSLIRQYDAKSKGVDSPGVDDGALLKELVFKILH